jgi:hypothetical protein
MLVQLVCIDRRYQRMNCFNIREAQALLKRKFFTDLLNSHKHTELLNKTALNLKFKLNDLHNLQSNTQLFFNYGLKTQTERFVSEFYMQMQKKEKIFQIKLETSLTNLLNDVRPRDVLQASVFF